MFKFHAATHIVSVTIFYVQVSIFRKVIAFYCLLTNSCACGGSSCIHFYLHFSSQSMAVKFLSVFTLAYYLSFMELCTFTVLFVRYLYGSVYVSHGALFWTYTEVF